MKLHNLGSADGIFAPNELHLSSIQTQEMKKHFSEFSLQRYFKIYANVYTVG